MFQARPKSGKAVMRASIGIAVRPRASLACLWPYVLCNFACIYRARSRFLPSLWNVESAASARKHRRIAESFRECTFSVCTCSCVRSVANSPGSLIAPMAPDSVCFVLPLHFPTGRFWLPGRLQHLLLCGIRKLPL
jgi:hypothetical protein